MSFKSSFIQSFGVFPLVTTFTSFPVSDPRYFNKSNEIDNLVQVINEVNRNDDDIHGLIHHYFANL